jgi:hypothetical protein
MRELLKKTLQKDVLLRRIRVPRLLSNLHFGFGRFFPIIFIVAGFSIYNFRRSEDGANG